MSRLGRAAIVLTLCVSVLAGAACSRNEPESPPAAKSGRATAPAERAPPAAMTEPPPAPLPPATLTDVNLVTADMGGAVEELTGFYGPGLAGRRLIDGLAEPTWYAPADWWPGGMYNDSYWTKYPQEIVFSFYERRPALVGAVTFVLPQASTLPVENDPSTAPADVEVWTSMDGAPGGFTRVAAAKLEPRGGEQTVTFPATEARFVKLRLLSGATKRVVEIAEVRILESVREGYEPLFAREPGASRWKGSPREAAQLGLYWLQQASTDWNFGKDGCFGCHVHAQALMGQTVALREGYRVSIPAMQALEKHIRTHQTPEGTFSRNSETTAAAYGAMALARAGEATHSTQDRELRKAVDYLIAAQKDDGSLPEDNQEPPIIQGQFVLAANALEGMQWVAATSRDPKYGDAAARAVAWIASNEPVTTQDLVFKIFTMNRYGTPDQKRAAWPLVETLAAQQQPDGGWKEVPAMEASNAFATGQVLYAFKQAGISIRSPMFQRGVEYLLKTQVTDPTTVNGFWKAAHTESQRKSDFAPTMWAVIGLAGAYGTEPKGALQIVREGDKIAAHNLEIVLDVSGSMNAKLGETTRWQTALATLKEVVAALPDDLNVGLRVYGHRYSSKSAQTCQDTELVVPIAPLDRVKIVDTASALKPRGETPLIRSVLKTVEDLKAAGGGSVILITDGEESCKGNAKSAAAQIKKSGVKVALNIVGFTLTGKAVESELAGLAGSTGGRYYSAQDGAQLSRAVKLAALTRLPYDLYDGTGKLLASGQTSALSRELAPGEYRVRIEALGQRLEEPLTIVPDQTTTLTLAIDNDKFTLRH
jgi:hypothetical protein